MGKPQQVCKELANSKDIHYIITLTWNVQRANPYKQKAKCACLGLGRNRSHYCKWVWAITLEWEKCAKTGLWWWLNNSANSLNITELKTLIGLMLWDEILLPPTFLGKEKQYAMWQRPNSKGHIIIWSYLNDISIKDKPIAKINVWLPGTGGREYKGISRGWWE